MKDLYIKLKTLITILKFFLKYFLRQFLFKPACSENMLKYRLDYIYRLIYKIESIISLFKIQLMAIDRGWPIIATDFRSQSDSIKADRIKEFQ